VTWEGINNRAVVRVPGDYEISSLVADFGFNVYYRIYTSARLELIPEETTFSAINSTLATDYTRVKPYVENENAGSYSKSSVLSGFYTLGNDLKSSVIGNTLVFDFSPTDNQGIPCLRLGGVDSGPYSTLFRAASDPSGNPVKPLPDNRYFTNDPELYKPDNVTATVNGDVVGGSSEKVYAYAMLYILGEGVNAQTLAQVYSTPTFLGVLRLPDTQATTINPVTKVTVTGAANVGKTLSAAVNADAEPVTWQWWRVDDEDVETQISGATNAQYTVDKADEGHTLKVKARNSANVELDAQNKTVEVWKASEPTDVVPYKPVVQVVITGTVKVGETLTAAATDDDGDNAQGVVYQWWRVAVAAEDEGEDGTEGEDETEEPSETAIPGATTAKYTVTASDAGFSLRVEARNPGNADGNGEEAWVSAGPVGPVE